MRSNSTATCRLFHRCLAEGSFRGPRDSEAVERAWTSFIRRHDTRIRRLFARLLCCRGLLFSQQDLEDYVQDFYCRLLSQGEQFSGRCDRELWSYFEAIAENLITDQFRFFWRTKRRAGVPEPQFPEVIEECAISLEDPERIALHQERRRLVFRQYLRRHVQGRGARIKRRALLMAVLEGRSSREVSRDLGNRLRPGHVDLLVHRFRRSLEEKEGLRLPRRRAEIQSRIKISGGAR